MFNSWVNNLYLWYIDAMDASLWATQFELSFTLVQRSHSISLFVLQCTQRWVLKVFLLSRVSPSCHRIINSRNFSISYRFKHCIVSSNIFTRHNPWSADQWGSNIADYITIKVGHHHHIKLLRIGNQLHTAVVNYHGVVFNIRVVLGNFTTTSQK